MDALSSVAIEIESVAASGNVVPLLHELRHALQRLRDDGSVHCIDLNSLPLTPQDYRQLDALLGQGEVSARLQALGESDISESRIPGIWRVTHFNTAQKVVGRYLEVTDCPDILKTARAELDTGIRNLQQLIDDSSRGL